MLVVASRGPKHKHKHKAPKHSKHKATTTSMMSGENDVFLKGTGSKSHPPVSSGLRMRDGPAAGGGGSPPFRLVRRCVTPDGTPPCGYRGVRSNTGTAQERTTPSQI